MSLKMIENERAAALSNSPGDFVDKPRGAERPQKNKTPEALSLPGNGFSLPVRQI